MNNRWLCTATNNCAVDQYSSRLFIWNCSKDKLGYIIHVELMMLHFKMYLWQVFPSSHRLNHMIQWLIHFHPQRRRTNRSNGLVYFSSFLFFWAGIKTDKHVCLLTMAWHMVAYFCSRPLNKNQFSLTKKAELFEGCQVSSLREQNVSHMQVFQIFEWELMKGHSV